MRSGSRCEIIRIGILPQILSIQHRLYIAFPGSVIGLPRESIRCVRMSRDPDGALLVSSVYKYLQGEHDKLIWDNNSCMQLANSL